MTAASYLVASVPLRLATSGVMVALPILAATEFDDLALGGQLVAATLGPSVLAAPLVGVILDRTRRPSHWMLAGAVLTAASYALTAALGDVPRPHKVPIFDFAMDILNPRTMFSVAKHREDPSPFKVQITHVFGVRESKQDDDDERTALVAGYG